MHENQEGTKVPIMSKLLLYSSAACSKCREQVRKVACHRNHVVENWVFSRSEAHPICVWSMWVDTMSSDREISRMSGSRMAKLLKRRGSNIEAGRRDRTSGSSLKSRRAEQQVCTTSSGCCRRPIRNILNREVARFRQRNSTRHPIAKWQVLLLSQIP